MVTVVVDGLDNPRNIAVDQGGNLYVAEAGAPRVGNQTGNPTGRVTKISKPGTEDQRLVWSQTSDAVFMFGEVEGPAGLSIVSQGCQDSVYVVIDESTLGYQKENPNVTAPPQLGHLYRLSLSTGSPTDVSDVGDQDYIWSAANSDLWQEFPDANPYGVLVIPSTGGSVRIFVVDAGANTVVEVYPNGSTKVLAFIQNDGVRDSTPTCAALGPDGFLYVGTLNLAKNIQNGSNQSDVWRIDPDTTENFTAAPKKWATNLTTVSACTFDRDGNFWATEYLANDVVRIRFDQPDKLERLGINMLPSPGGITEGPDGEFYVTVNISEPTPGAGAVVKLEFSG